MPADPQTLPRIDRYPGAKAGAGVYQAIINQFPPHDVYVEAFVGSGQIYLRKRPAPASIVIDAERSIVEHWNRVARAARSDRAGDDRSLTVIRGDARAVLRRLAFQFSAARVLVYCDPPYVRAVRRSSSPIYRHELTDADHRELLILLGRGLPASWSVAVSGYRCPLYDMELRRWRRVDIAAMTRGGPAVESLWCNYPQPEELHESTYLGANFRERERIKRKRARWRRRLAAMPPLERRAMLEDLKRLELASPAVSVRTCRDPRAVPDDGRRREIPQRRAQR